MRPSGSMIYIPSVVLLIRTEQSVFEALSPASMPREVWPISTMVTRTALQNAASIAGLLLTTEALVTEKPEKKDKMPAHPDMGGMY